MHQPREVAVAVPVVLPSISQDYIQRLDLPSGIAEPSKHQPLFLVCSSRKHPERFVLPKGGIEKGETAQAAAIREGWEEAGFRGSKKAVTLGGPIDDTRPSKHKEKSHETPRARYHFVLVQVLDLESDWPEKHERTRRWCTWSELEQLVAWRNENAEGLSRVPRDYDALVSMATAS